MVAGGDFTVTVSKKEVVAAVLPLQDHWLPFSNLDLLLPPIDVSVFFCYHNPSLQRMTFASMVAILKRAPGSNASVILRPRRIKGKLVPNKKNGVLSIQATELNCGGLVVACTFDHRIADAYSVNMFLVSWAELAQSRTISLLPSFRRSLLNPRRPGCVDPAFDDMYVTFYPPPPPKEPVEATHDHLISRIYYVTKDQLNELQSLASPNGCRRTKLESFSAFLWKMVAQCGATDNDKTSQMGIVVDGRISMTQDHFLGLIDWVEAHRPQPAVAKIYINGSANGPAFVVSSGQRFPVSKVDFGWGKPAFGSYHFPWGGDAGYVMPMRSPLGNGDWVVYLHLLKKQIEMIEKEASDVFRPLTSDYLEMSLMTSRQ
ncbi:hypothetical protein Patl1_30949 [Pistacia atlantica]|uniref:Uncharacterized protein n=1 Tax=Pistacia atlantica TaxID=434234 RepID=A0ACC1AFE1_9ROSI|nr:hypothetical protein Patl1_30949 [Pistacia atlantica]